MLWSVLFNTLLGVFNADATGDATGTQRLQKPIGGDTLALCKFIWFITATPAGRTRRDKTCLGDEGENATKFPGTRPLLAHRSEPHSERRLSMKRSVCVPRLV
jgi:hypothetical protein